MLPAPNRARHCPAPGQPRGIAPPLTILARVERTLHPLQRLVGPQAIQAGQQAGAYQARAPRPPQLRAREHQGTVVGGAALQRAGLQVAVAHASGAPVHIDRLAIG